MSDAAPLWGDDPGTERLRVVPTGVPAAHADAAALDICVMTGGPGPTMLLTGGVHGDEYEGPLLLSRFVREMSHERLAGRLVIIPRLNPSALAARRRCSPIDDRDLNRSFPGSPDGGVTAATAHFVSQSIVPHVDIVYDLHAGGVADAIVPAVMIHPLRDAEQMKANIASGLAFGAPMCLVVEEPDTEAMFDHDVERRGKIFGCVELGSGGTVEPDVLRLGRQGVMNLLVHHGMIDGARAHVPWRDWGATRLMHADHAAHVFAPAAGLFEPNHMPGDAVERGDSLGWILDDGARDAPRPIAAPRSGRLFVRSGGGPVAAGQFMATIANDMSEDEILSQTRARFSAD